MLGYQGAHCGYNGYQDLGYVTVIIIEYVCQTLNLRVVQTSLSISIFLRYCRIEIIILRLDRDSNEEHCTGFVLRAGCLVRQIQAGTAQAISTAP
jgi:hypothetical protein